MQNKELKQELIAKEIYQQYCSAHNEFYQSGLEEQDRNLYPFLTDEEYKACEQLRRAKQKQRQKICEWLSYYIQQEDLVILFGTQSFNDNALQSSFGARAKQIQRMLTQFVDYVSNVDYGKENEREHYHFIVVARPETIRETEWKKMKRKNRLYASSLPQTENFLYLGWQNWQMIDREDSKINEKISGYLAKLVNHSLKIHQTKLGYKRKSPFQALKADLTALYREKEKKGGLDANDYQNGYKWLTDRKVQEWLNNSIDYPMP